MSLYFGCVCIEMNIFVLSMNACTYENKDKKCMKARYESFDLFHPSANTCLSNSSDKQI